MPDYKYQKDGDYSRIMIGDVPIGNKSPLLVIAGPCAVENAEMLDSIASLVKNEGVPILRSGTNKPRTSPYDFQGLSEEGLKLLRAAGDKYGLKVISEIMDPRLVMDDSEYLDIVQVGSRNMQNFPLLREVGKLDKPVLLKRGFGNTMDELLKSAEYILSSGNDSVILTLRGVRPHTYTNDFVHDYKDITELKKLTHLPIVYDITHSSTSPMNALAELEKILETEPDGLMMEVHNNPESALSDADKQMPPSVFMAVMDQLRKRK